MTVSFLVASEVATGACRRRNPVEDFCGFFVQSYSLSSPDTFSPFFLLIRIVIMVGKGRQKTKLKLIEKKESRLVCFSKRRSGLFKKVRELSILSGAKIGGIVFSPADMVEDNGSQSIKNATFWLMRSPDIQFRF